MIDWCWWYWFTNITLELEKVKDQGKEDVPSAFTPTKI
jgi:hypothetical protein